MRKSAKNMTAEDIEHCLGLLKDALSVPCGHLRVDEILSFFETECKRVLSLFHDVPPKSISNLSDANETFWLEREFPHYASPFGEAVTALAAIFSLKDAYARRDSYEDDFAAWAKEEADLLGGRLKIMLLGKLETGRTQAHFNLDKGRKSPKKALAIWGVYHRLLAGEPSLTHDNLIKRITCQIPKENFLEYSLEENEKTYHVSLGPDPEKIPFEQKDLDTDKIIAPAKSTLYRHYYLPIQKILHHKKI